MLSPIEATQYQRNSNERAGYGYCQSCTKPLQPTETYVCDECAQTAYVETNPNGAKHDGKSTQRGPRP